MSPRIVTKEQKTRARKAFAPTPVQVRQGMSPDRPSLDEILEHAPGPDPHELPPRTKFRF